MSARWLWLVAKSRQDPTMMPTMMTTAESVAITETVMDGAATNGEDLWKRIPDPYDFVSDNPILRQLRGTEHHLLIGAAYPERVTAAILRQRRINGEFLTASEFCEQMANDAGPPAPPAPEPLESQPTNDTTASVPTTVRKIVLFDLRRPVDLSQLLQSELCGNRLSSEETESLLPTGRVTHQRWYPVIDRVRCTGCGECVNFCIFGVYGIGADGLPRVIQPDACRPGCPPCARVCPCQAILFPHCDEPEISGETPPLVTISEDKTSARKKNTPSNGDDHENHAGHDTASEAERVHKLALAERGRCDRERNRPRPPIPAESREETISRWMLELDALDADEPDAAENR